ncbi:CaiB/BaiF CoA transferase family protein [Streptomyces sp. NPDC094448]|uniref:CaiB/BaiF CoA transferase family protein n=1 Tax=Streptomyces sp. NPDC094448 TaxID=3366063 RepID=UPI0038131AA0
MTAAPATPSSGAAPPPEPPGTPTPKTPSTPSTPGATERPGPSGAALPSTATTPAAPSGPAASHPAPGAAPSLLSTPAAGPPAAPLHGLRVLDLATLFAGPLAATLLGDFGAEVVKVEHPRRPDPSRGHGPAKDGIGLWWKLLGRNKRTITLDLSAPGGRDTLLKLAAGADVIIENFRPGTLEKWGLGWEELRRANPRLVLARVTGFGQSGPYSHRPGFGTLAEAMSGFAAATGEPDGPPTLPPFGLADSIAALATSYAVMTALAARTATGRGQVVDMAIIEPILTVLGPQPLWYDQLGYVQPRLGNRSRNNAPRNTYRTADDCWVAVSTSAQSVAERVMRLVGRPALIDEPWFATGSGRAEHADELDEAVGAWIARRPRSEVLAAFEKAEAAIAPVYDIRDVMDDPQYRALDTVTEVEDPELGTIRMQNVLFRLSETPGAIRWTGRPHGADTDAVLTELGLTADDISALRAQGAL